MAKIISKLRMGRICLISFILLCCVFTSENAFSVGTWQKSDVSVNYNQNDKTITIDFLFYYYHPASGELCYLNWCDFSYGQWGDLDVHGNHKTKSLFIANAKAKLVMASSSIVIRRKTSGESIMLMSDVGNNPKVPKLIDGEIYESVERKVRRVGSSDIARMSVKWDVSQLKKEVNLIHVVGLWSTKGKQSQTISEDYPFRMITSNSNVKDGSVVLKSEITNQVKVTGETDAISVTGADPGENIKVYTASGVEVKAVVANDDAVNIKLPTNQIYIVKAGQERYKVAL